jgi:Thermolysin metallopeptidase, alpha-helical domain
LGSLFFAASWFCLSQDFGVHINSGIVNKAFVLMVEGGVHPVSQIEVPALNGDFDTSLLEAAHIFYHANTKCLSENSDFSAARQCTLMFATTPTQVETVTKAWDAVGVMEGTGGNCVPKLGHCSIRTDCCGTRLTCDGPVESKTCKRCKRLDQPCARGSSCCLGLKCRRKVCVAKSQ